MEANDYDSDFRFGKWLKDQRSEKGLSLEQASNEAVMSAERLNSLELGYAEKSITQPEAEGLSKLYQIPLGKIISMAIYCP